MKKKTIALLMAAVMLFGITVGGTIAWLTASTDEVTNTFVAGNIVITLDEADVNLETTVDGETTITYAEYVKGNKDKKDDGSSYVLDEADRVKSNKYEIIPGTTYSKDPKVVVKANSEACYLFVKFEEIGNPSTYYTYTSNLNDTNGWIQLSGENDVWYRKLNESTTDQSFWLLGQQGGYVKGGIIVKDTVTLDNMDDAKAASLKWTAYAVQSANMTDAQAAWNEVSK